jgi:hypothetical protein
MYATLLDEETNASKADWFELNNPADPNFVPKKRDFFDELKLLSVDLCDMELRGVKLPEKETFLGDLVAQQIVDKITSFHERLNREAFLGIAPFAESYFLNLIALYPVSMCNRNMTETLKLVVSLFYFGSQPTETEKKKRLKDEVECKELFPSITPSRVYGGYSYDDLAMMFDRTKSAIVEAIKQKQGIAKIMLEEATIRCDSKEKTLEHLAEEEKTKLNQDKRD